MNPTRNKRNDNILGLINAAFKNASDAHVHLTESTMDIRCQIIAGQQIAKASNIIAFAMSLDYLVEDVNFHTLLSNVYQRFTAFENEFLSNLESGHSHQVTKIRFFEFANSVKQLNTRILENWLNDS